VVIVTIYRAGVVLRVSSCAGFRKLVDFWRTNHPEMTKNCRKKGELFTSSQIITFQQFYQIIAHTIIVSECEFKFELKVVTVRVRVLLDPRLFPRIFFVEPTTIFLIEYVPGHFTDLVVDLQIVSVLIFSRRYHSNGSSSQVTQEGLELENFLLTDVSVELVQGDVGA